MGDNAGLVPLILTQDLKEHIGTQFTDPLFPMWKVVCHILSLITIGGNTAPKFINLGLASAGVDITLHLTSETKSGHVSVQVLHYAAASSQDG